MKVSILKWLGKVREGRTPLSAQMAARTGDWEHTMRRCALNVWTPQMIIKSEKSPLTKALESCWLMVSAICRKDDLPAKRVERALSDRCQRSFHIASFFFSSLF